MNTETTTILLFKTNIHSPSEELQLMLDQHLAVQYWSVDTEDVDRVLKIVSDPLYSEDIVDRLRSMGYSCEELL